MIRSRIAPTPSGFLHLGNAVNFVLTWLLTRSEKGMLRLRIDDLDAPRITSDYVDDVFRTLEWLGIDWEEGPQTPGEHFRSFSQQLRIERYNELIRELKEKHLLFACCCSRKEIQEHSADGQYPGTCRNKGVSPDQQDVALRIITSSPCTIQVNDMRAGKMDIDLFKMARDPVVKRRDQIPAYHIASLADDIDYGINLIVRGEDLLYSTAVQLFIGKALHKKQFINTRFYHHPLIQDEHGHKLSKSAGSTSIKAWRERGAKAEEFYRLLSRMLKAGEEAGSPGELLQLLNEGRLALPVMRY